MEILAYRSYSELGFPINFWRTKSGLEVDFIPAHGAVAIEFKGARRVSEPDLRALRSFAEEFKPTHALLISTESVERAVGTLRFVPWRTFLTKLWGGK